MHHNINTRVYILHLYSLLEHFNFKFGQVTVFLKIANTHFIFNLIYNYFNNSILQVNKIC